MAFIVLDTNVALDLLVFNDAGVLPLSKALRERRLQWIATTAMREELARVLGYARLAPWLAASGLSAPHVLSRFDEQVRVLASAPPALLRCRDPDDQGFIDLALLHRAILLSKDKAILAMSRRVQMLCAKALIHRPAAFLAAWDQVTDSGGSNIAMRSLMESARS